MPATTESAWTWAWYWWGTLVAINGINLILCISLLIRFLAIFAELSFAGLIAKSLLRMNADVPELIPAKNRVAGWSCFS